METSLNHGDSRLLALSTALFHLECYLLYKVGAEMAKDSLALSQGTSKPPEAPAGCFQLVQRLRLGSKPVPDVISSLGPILCSHVSN